MFRLLHAIPQANRVEQDVSVDSATDALPQQLSSVPLQLSTAHRIACLLHVERCSTVAASAAVT
jgi:hypothetical protein